MEKKVSHLGTWLTVGLIAALSLVNLLLVKQNFELRKQLSERATKIDATANSLKAGEFVAPPQTTFRVAPIL